MARIARTQHGLVTRAQLRAAGLGSGAIAYRVERGRLHRLHRSVYLVGHPVAPPFARELAPVLAVGDGAVLSHRSAAALWSMAPVVPGEFEVSVVGRDCRPRPGVRVHQVRTLDHADRTTRQGVPVTTPVRTLLDLAEVLDARDLERAYAEARAIRLLVRNRVVAALARHPRRHGTPALRRLVEREDAPALTRSEAEERLLALVRRARLPEPRANVRLGRHEVDFHWRETQLVVEVDGHAFHSTRAAFERDRARDAELAAGGLRVIRVTWRQIAEEPEVVVARVAQALVRGKGLAR